MKTILAYTLFFFISSELTGQVKISNTATNPHPSAMLEIESSNKGLLLPKMTDGQMQLISNPALGLLVFNTTDSLLYMHVDAGWTKLATGQNFWQHSTQNIYNKNSGNIGIGIANPLQKLHLNGNAQIDGNIYMPNSTASTGVIYKDGIPFLHNAGLVAQQNVYLGTGAGSFNTLAKKNVAVGSYALSNSDGADNIAIGYAAGASLSGGTTYSESLKNLFVGYLCGLDATGGIENIAIGVEAGYNLKSGSQKNILIGANAGKQMLTGIGNVLIGYAVSTVSGISNTGMGSLSGLYMNSGSYNTWMGNESLFRNQSGWNNVVVGNKAAYADSIGSNNVYIGAFSAQFTQGSGNVFMGTSAGVGDNTLLNNTYILNNNSSALHLMNGNFGTYKLGVKKTLADLLYTLDIGGEIRIGSLTTIPAPNNGVVYYNAVDNKLKTVEDGVWKNVVYDNIVKDKNTDPNTSDVPANTFHIWRNTTSGNIYLWVNDNGIMRKVQIL